MNLLTAHNVLCMVSAESSTLKKVAILKKFQTEELRQVFELAYSKKHNFFITSKGYEKLAPTTTGNYRDNLDIFAKLSSRAVTGNDAISEFNLACANQTSEQVVNLFKNILDRDLRCGVTLTLAAQVWPDLEKKYPIMLALADDPKARKKFKPPFIAQRKSDGARVNLHVDVLDSTVVAYSRNGKLVDCINVSILTEALAVARGLDLPHVILDGELLYREPDGTAAARTKGNGIVNKAVRNTISDAERDGLYLTVWDYIPMLDFEAGKGTTTYANRWMALATVFEHSKLRNGLKLIESKLVNTWDEALDWYREEVANGGEGLIIKSLTGLWEAKRSNSQMKLKECIEADVLITGMYAGEPGTKYEHTLGGFSIESANGIVKSNMGSGISDELRDEYWNNSPVGKIAQIEYNAITEDKKTGQKSFFLPVFVCVRDDKTEPDAIT